jgi:hypothetical protein
LPTLIESCSAPLLDSLPKLIVICSGLELLLLPRLSTISGPLVLPVVVPEVEVELAAEVLPLLKLMMISGPGEVAVVVGVGAVVTTGAGSFGLPGLTTGVGVPPPEC